MKKLRNILMLATLFVMIWGNTLTAQDSTGTYIDNTAAQDSSYDEEGLKLDEYYQEEKGSGSSAFLIGAAVAIVVGAVVIYAIRKKSKK